MKIYIYLFTGIAAIALMTVNVFNFDPKTESWSSMILGAAVGYVLYRMFTKARNGKQKAAK